MIISSQQYKKLIRDQEKLEALECAGVDNWMGYGESLCDLRKQWKKEDIEEKIEINETTEIHLVLLANIRNILVDFLEERKLWENSSIEYKNIWYKDTSEKLNQINKILSKYLWTQNI